MTSVSLRDDRTRLALTYLAIIMALSLGFSVLFYRQSVSEANAGLERQTIELRPNLYFTTPDSINQIRIDGVRDFRHRLVQRLVLLNLGMLAAGTLVSFYLAKRSLRPLEETLQAQSRFTSDAAHELRTPLTAMKTEIEVALRSGKLSAPEYKQLLASNLEEIDKLETLTAALLRLAKSQQSVDPSTLPAIRIAEVTAAAHERVQSLAEAKSMTIQLPPAEKSLKVRGDTDQLVEALVVLMDNAVKYSPKKSVVEVRIKDDGERLRLSVHDQGIGIKAGDMPHVFERFYRADQSRNKSQVDGYGLGLSLADAIIRAHGGAIEADSTPGKGSVFTIFLPLA